MKKRWLLLLLVVILGVAVYFWNQLPSRSDEFSTAGPEDVTMRFPANFKWGVALSGTQAESQQGSDWAAFERDVITNHRFRAEQKLGTTEPGNIRAFGKWSDKVRRSNSNFDLMYPQDLAMAAAMGVNAFRISFEWARLFPRADMTEPSPEGIAYYKALLAEMKRNHITPFVTLYHYVSPEWFFQADASGKRGWERRDALEHWQRYINAVATNFVPDVEYWCTLNEPMVYLYSGYMEGLYPPLEERSDISDVADVYENLLRAHAIAYKTLHDAATDRKANVNVGIAQNVAAFSPLRNWSLMDRLTTYFVAQVWDWDFLDAIETGRLRVRLAGIDRTIPGLKGTEDYVGINYYSRNYVKGSWRHPMAFQTFDHDPDRAESRSENGWTNFPRGLYAILTKADAKYHKPIYILENGTCDSSADDIARQKYLVAHVREVWLAINQGHVDVRSYLQWSLIDNLEWVDGFDARFGLVAVDYENDFKRTPRPSAKLYGEIVHANALSPELLKTTLAKPDRPTN